MTKVKVLKGLSTVNPCLITFIRDRLRTVESECSSNVIMVESLSMGE
jgi:hypothetical protein